MLVDLVGNITIRKKRPEIADVLWEREKLIFSRF